MTVQQLKDVDIRSTFGCGSGDVARHRRALNEAASEEYANMVTGRYLVPTISAAREFRIFLLVKHVYPGSLPAPNVVAALFRVSLADGRRLLRSSLARYRDELKANTRAQTKAMLSPLRMDEDGVFRLATDADYLVEAMNAELPSLGKELRRISRFPGTAALYRVERDTLDALIALH
jgi:hypothetical protein